VLPALDISDRRKKGVGAGQRQQEIRKRKGWCCPTQVKGKVGLWRADSREKKGESVLDTGERRGKKKRKKL